MDLNEFSKKLSDHINNAIRAGIPVPFVCMTLDMSKFELQSQNLMLMQRDQAMQMAAESQKSGTPFKPKIVIEGK